MSIRVLQSRDEFIRARRVLRERGASALTIFPQAVAHRLRLMRRPPIGSLVKSWDILETLRLIETEVDVAEPILDIGAWSSEILPVLHQLDYRNLTGIDLNPRLPLMPHAGSIRYIVGDFYTDPSLQPATFAAITAISVIEHGFNLPALISRISTLLRPGGIFVATTDYWPTRIDTSSLRPFGLPWQIFSREDLQQLLERASKANLVPVGQLSFDCSERPLRWMGQRYTAAWIALRRGS